MTVASLLPHHCGPTPPALPARAPTPAPRHAPCSIPPADWNLLLQAVTYRLRNDVPDLASAAPAARDVVLECANALDLLQAALSQERGYLRRIETQLKTAHAALATTRAQLAGTVALPAGRLLEAP